MNRDPVRTPLDPQATQAIRAMVLMLLPQQFEDDDDWGAEKRIQSGLDVDVDGLRIETRRRWKTVNHGSWKRASGRLVEPDRNFQIRVWVLPSKQPGERRYELEANARIRVTGQQRQWNTGVMLWSVSADATADVQLKSEFSTTQQIVETDRGARLRFVPTVDRATVRLLRLHVSRVSHIKGTVAEEFGRWIDDVVKRQVARQGDRLTDRINQRIQKKPERFEIPLGLGAWISEQDPKANDQTQGSDGQTQGSDGQTQGSDGQAQGSDDQAQGTTDP
ncbi:MAG: hypothetical protein KDA96_10275 [Planctomycetaceae bacterium]|nr:hypothetical protein [Planctomycetaceae bacterium]